jgi:hypothetical protein
MIKEYLLKAAHHWKILLKDKTYLISFLIGWAVLISSFIASYYSSVYVDYGQFNPVGDAILDSIPTYNLEFLFIWGFYSLILLTIAYPAFVKPEIAPFMLKTFGILILTRACFILLTHVGPPEGFFYETHADYLTNPLKELIFRNDLFFSGHTSVPFLSFLLFKGTKLRWVMFGGSLIMGATVLIMHVHYSIDVFAAFFIAHGVYVFSNRVFNSLNAKFSEKIRIFGWKAMKDRVANLRIRDKNKAEEYEEINI